MRVSMIVATSTTRTFSCSPWPLTKTAESDRWDDSSSSASNLENTRPPSPPGDLTQQPCTAASYPHPPPWASSTLQMHIGEQHARVPSSTIPIAPTPREYFLQKLGLCITKAMTLHLRNSFKKLGTHPNKQFVPAPPGFDPETDPQINLIDTSG